MRTRSNGHDRPLPVLRMVAATTCLVALLSGCGDDSGTTTSADPNTIQVTPEDFLKEVERQENAPACEDFYRDGAITTAEMDGTACKQPDGGMSMPGTAHRDCADGRALLWNDEGWGHIGEPWSRHADPDYGVPPEDVLSDCDQ